MKRSELKLTGDRFDLTPDTWGEEYIITDDDLAIETMKESFGDEFEDNGKRSGTVEIAIDEGGNFYAILEPHEATSWGHKTGEVFNQDMYRQCQNPDECTDGLCEIYGRTWGIFEDENED